jgi:phosphonate metabolism protein PhnN/1,5-bisphosphokinase (PRPP-forming)
MSKKEYPGTLFLVVGNSGSGKDSIISGVIENYPSYLKKIYSPPRYITRKASTTEGNIYVSPEEFKSLEKQGKFALRWYIYGLNYGIPIKIDSLLRNGHPVIMNVSRTIINNAKKRYKNIKVIFIKIPFELTVKRLRERGRESGNLLEKRIKRAKTHQTFPKADYILDNSGSLDKAVSQCLEYIIEASPP